MPTRLFPRQPPSLQLGRVQRVADGHTIEVVVDRRAVEVAFAGVDVPLDADAPGGCAATPALDYLVGALEGRTVALEREPLTPDRDRRGRWIRYVWLEEAWRDDDVLVDVALARAGLGRDVSQRLYYYHDRLAEAGSAARAAGAGLWGCAG